MNPYIRLINKNTKKLDSIRVLLRQVTALENTLSSDLIALEIENKCTNKYLNLKRKQVDEVSEMRAELMVFVGSTKTQRSIDSTLQKAEEFWKPYKNLFPK